MSSINSFSDQDCERISRAVRKSEGLPVKFERRPPPIPYSAESNPYLVRWEWLPWNSVNGTEAYLKPGQSGTERHLTRDKWGDASVVGVKFTADSGATSPTSGYTGESVQLMLPGTYLVGQLIRFQNGPDSTSGLWTGLVESVAVAGITYTFGFTNYRDPAQYVAFQRTSISNALIHEEIINVSSSQAPASLLFGVQAELSAKSNANNNLNAGDFSTKLRVVSSPSSPNLAWVMKLQDWPTSYVAY